MWRPINIPNMKVWFLDRLGWPVEKIKGRPVLNFFRLLIHTRKITTRWAYLEPIDWSHVEDMWKGVRTFRTSCDTPNISNPPKSKIPTVFGEVLPGTHAEIKEGSVCKGGVNRYPTTPPPKDAPKGQGGSRS